MSESEREATIHFKQAVAWNNRMLVLLYCHASAKPAHRHTHIMITLRFTGFDFVSICIRRRIN